MGLDSVELVLNVEDRFNIALADNQCSRVRTVADLAALVMASLPADNGRCQTAVAFHELRRWLMTHAGIERSRTRPAARLDELLPSPRKIWKAFTRHRRSVPHLVPSPEADRVISLATWASITVWMPASAAMWITLGRSAGVTFAMFTFLAGAVSIAVVSDRLAVHFAPGLETIADLARCLAPIANPKDNFAARAAVEQQVLGEVRRLTAEQLNLPLDRVSPESSFRDLGMY